MTRARGLRGTSRDDNARGQQQAIRVVPAALLRLGLAHGLSACESLALPAPSAVLHGLSVVRAWPQVLGGLALAPDPGDFRSKCKLAKRNKESSISSRKTTLSKRRKASFRSNLAERNQEEDPTENYPKVNGTKYNLSNEFEEIASSNKTIDRSQ